jgi:hypothetical protein
MELKGVALFFRKRLAQRNHLVQEQLDSGGVLWKFVFRQIVPQSMVHGKQGRIGTSNLDARS